MPDEQLRDLKRIMVPAIVLLLVVTSQLLALILFGDTDIGEPNVTRADIPALAFILTAVLVIVVAAFLLASRMSKFVTAYENDDDGSESKTPFYTWAVRGFIVLWIALLWPDRWNPLPDRLVETSVFYIGTGAAVLALAIIAVTWRKMEILRG